MAAARHWLRAQPGGVPAIPTWGKFWLALIGLYDYRGLHPCPPELFLAPAWLPVHPRRYYCHTRSIYLAMAYLYGRRTRASLGPITEALRHELYTEPFERIDFAAHRDSVAPSDRCIMPSALLRVAFAALNAHERIHSRRRRRRALDHCFARILFEQKASRYQGLSPVNALLNCLAIWATDPAHPELDPSLAGLEAWKWQDEDAGCRYAGARSQTWDTAFAVHALRALPECSDAVGCLVAPGPRVPSRRSTDERAARIPRGVSRSRARRLVLLRWPASLAGQRLHGGSAVGRPRDPRGPGRAGRSRADGGGAPGAGGGVSPQPPEPGRWIRHLRAAARRAAARAPESLGDVHALHDGAVVCRVHRLGHRRAGPCPGRASATSPRRDRPRHRARRPVPAWSPATRRRLSGLLGNQLHLRDLPRGTRAASVWGARGRSGPDRRRPMAHRRAARRRRLGRALLGLSRGPLRRAPGEPGGHDGLGALGPHGHRRSPVGCRRSRARVAPAEAAAGWLLAPAGGQWRVLRVGDAGLPPVQELFPGLGVDAGRGPDAHREDALHEGAAGLRPFGRERDESRLRGGSRPSRSPRANSRRHWCTCEYHPRASEQSARARSSDVTKLHDPVQVRRSRWYPVAASRQSRR